MLPALTLQLGPLPSTVVTRFFGTMSPSDSHPGPACPSRASGWGGWCRVQPRTRPPAGWVSRVASVLLADMPSRSGSRLGRLHPRRTRGTRRCSALFSPRREGLAFHGGGLPPCTAGSASASFVSRPARRSRVLRPACLLSHLKRPFDIGSLSRFAFTLPARSPSPSSVPTATGWNSKLPGRGLSPAGEQRLSTAHGA